MSEEGDRLRDRLRALRTNTTDGAADPYDHAISLIDTTLQQSDRSATSRESSPDSHGRDLAKKPTRASVREQIARRKYKKWQQERYSSTEAGPSAAAQAGKQGPDTGEPSEPPDTDTTDFAHNNGPTLDHAPSKHERGRKRPKEQPYEIDILYENQRGLFFCGIPLYSHSSLLNFDPAPWVTKDLKDSAVNITNAQVPDPSWEWTWKTWYVDMSYDVDEEGWQYSFSFGKRWAWHGTHPWFHSYVRRRRWLRKRVKRHARDIQAGDNSMGAAHLMTADYFTIHPKRDRSPASTTDGGPKTARISFGSTRSFTETDEQPEDVKSIPSLLKALRLATIDREKIEAVNKFVEQGEEELFYLTDHMPEIMSYLIFKTSRGRLVQSLQQALDETRQRLEENKANNKPEDETQRRRLDYLQKAVEATKPEAAGFEYWSDLKDILNGADEPGDGSSIPKSAHTAAMGTGETDLTDEKSVDSIKGISSKAELDSEPAGSGLEHPATTGEKEPDSEPKEEHSSMTDSRSDHLPPDTIILPDTVKEQ